MTDSTRLETLRAIDRLPPIARPVLLSTDGCPIVPHPLETGHVVVEASTAVTTSWTTPAPGTALIALFFGETADRAQALILSKHDLREHIADLLSIEAQL